MKRVGLIMAATRKRKLEFGLRQTRNISYDQANDSLNIEDRSSQLTDPTYSATSRASSTDSIQRQLSNATTSPEKRARIAAKQFLDKAVDAFNEGLAELLADECMVHLSSKHGFTSRFLYNVAEIYRTAATIENIIKAPLKPKKYNKNKNWLGKMIIDHYSIADAHDLLAARIVLSEFRDNHLRMYERAIRSVTRTASLNSEIITLKEISATKNSVAELTYAQANTVKSIMERIDAAFVMQYTNENAFEFLRTHMRDHITSISDFLQPSATAAEFILCLIHEFGLVFANNKFNIRAADERSMEIAKIFISKAAALNYQRSVEWIYRFNNPLEGSLKLSVDTDAETASDTSTDTVALEQHEEDNSDAFTSSAENSNSESESDIDTDSETESVNWNTEAQNDVSDDWDNASNVETDNYNTKADDDEIVYKPTRSHRL
jgi:sulfur relay (sulfurtransferase) DsrC/TusE family protein